MGKKTIIGEKPYFVEGTLFHNILYMVDETVNVHIHILIIHKNKSYKIVYLHQLFTIILHTNFAPNSKY